MKLRVFSVGKLSDAGLESLCAEYVKRSRRLLPIERQTLKNNAAAIAQAQDGCQRTVVLDERGEQLTTDRLSQWLGAWRDQGIRSIGFVVGDAHGFDETQRRTADRVLALSQLTLPHRLAQTLLCEQLYRVGTVLAGHPYHH